ncbi:MAG: hypothetical protein FGM33_06920 [Candidatus Kapabacteria bacterium]|nr:hypothetical protein [Candidatus Kapabacteria bacterium]
MKTALFLINVLARVGVVAVGLLLLTGQLSLFSTDTSLNETFGLIVVLFGLYRLIQYLSIRKNDPDEHT